MDMLKVVLTEARDGLRKEIGKERKAGTKVTDEDLAAAVDEIDMNAHTRKTFWIGYLRGAAEAQDLTITQLLEAL